MASIFVSIDSETLAAFIADVARELQIEDTARESAFSFEVNLGRAQRATGKKGNRINRQHG